MTWWYKTKILEVVTGSHGYGLAMPESDVDIGGICMLPRKYLLGLSGFEQGEGPQQDQVTYGLPKFVKLALDANPNILELLFAAEKHYRYLNEYGQRLLEARDLFLSKKAKFTFSGYGFSQLKRIERHHRWLVNPLQEPHQEDFGGVQESGTFRWPHTHQEEGYKNARKHWQEYRTWRGNRNPERAAMEERFGYDTKHALHLCRLLVMGKELLTEGTLSIDRTGIDADWLLAVRNGLYTYEELIVWAEEAEAEIDAVYETSPLPHRPDRKAAEKLLVEMQWDFFTG